MRCSTCASKSVSLWKKKPMGAALSFLGQKLFASSTLIIVRDAKTFPAALPSQQSSHPSSVEDARLAVYKIRLADSFLSTDRGRYLYWVDAALGTLNWALFAEGAYTGSRLAAWISSNFATATYSETTNSLSVAYDGNRLILNDLELQQQFPDAVDYPTSPAASPSPSASTTCSAPASSPAISRSSSSCA